VLWQRRSPWVISIGLGTLLCVFGFFSALAAVSFGGQDVWVYLITQVTELAVGISEAGIAGSAQCIHNSGDRDRAGLRQQSNLLFVVHLAAWFLLDLETDSSTPLGASPDGLRRGEALLKVKGEYVICLYPARTWFWFAAVSGFAVFACVLGFTETGLIPVFQQLVLPRSPSIHYDRRC